MSREDIEFTGPGGAILAAFLPRIAPTPLLMVVAPDDELAPADFATGKLVLELQR